MDAIVAQLRAQSTADAAVDPTLAFEVRPDAYRYQNLGAGAWVFVYQSNLTPQGGRSARAVHFEYDIEYIFDLIVEHKGSSTGATYQRGDELAGQRLRFLEQQIIEAVTDTSWYDLGLTPGTVGRHPLPRFEPLPPEIANQGERPIIGARGWWELSLSWDPARVTGPDLDSINVDAGQFAALYEYGG